VTDKKIILDTNQEKKLFIISGDITRITRVFRMMFSLKKIGYQLLENTLICTFTTDNHEKIIKDTISILDKFNIEFAYSSRTDEAMESFIREQESFGIFSHRAKEIRDDNFKNDNLLMREFNDFVESVNKNLIRTLYPLQLLSAYHMTFTQNACNFAVPGAGKTSIVYAAYAYLKDSVDPHRHVDNIVVIGPTASFKAWINEFEKCFGRKPTYIRLSSVGHEERKNHLYSSRPAELTILSYNILERYADDLSNFMTKNKTMLVVDEAHYIKNIDGIWSNALLKFSPKAISRIALTGTPAANGYEDIYNLYRYIWPQKFEKIIGMNYASLKMIKTEKFNNAKIERLSENIAPFYIRIKKKDLMLPPAIDNEPILVNMSENQRKIYDIIETKYVKEFSNKSDKSLRDIFSRAKLIRLRQAATNPGLLIKPLDDYYHELGMSDDIGFSDNEIIANIKHFIDNEIPLKYKTVLDVINKISTNNKNEKVLIWSIFVNNSKDLKRFLEDNGIKTELLIGEIDVPERESIVERFDNPNNTDFRIVIANPRVIGESVSLHHGCHNAVYLDMDYNASSLVQSKDRIHRVGLKEGTITNYYYILSKNSIDEVIKQKLDGKIELMNKLIDSDIPLFLNNTSENDSADLVKGLLNDYARRSN